LGGRLQLRMGDEELDRRAGKACGREVLARDGIN
jgi:hypothetical protein